LPGGLIGSPTAEAAADRSAIGASGAPAAITLKPVVASDATVSVQSRGLAKPAASASSEQRTAGSDLCHPDAASARPGSSAAQDEVKSKALRSGSGGAYVLI
jgi:hypothetical protein